MRRFQITNPIHKKTTLKKKIGILFFLVVVLFFGWRIVRPLNIFVVEDKFSDAIPVTIPEGLDSIRAESCGVCHPEIYREWSQSIHAHAWTDPYYQVDMAFENLPHVCITCHIPMETQQENLVLGYRDRDKLDPILSPNPNFDPEYQQEGVTCAVCHLREGKIVGPYPTDNAPHPVKVDPDFLSKTSPCDRCHVVSGDRWDMFYRIAPCGTMEEILESGESPDCVGCHMPSVIRPVAVGGSPKKVGRHLFRGGHHQETVKGALTVTHRLIKNDGKLNFIYTLTNTGTHHKLPTGTPDRHLTIHFKLMDKTGQVIQEETHTMIRSFWWRPFIVELSDSRLPYNQPRDFSFVVEKKFLKKAAVLDVEVRYHLLQESRRKRINYINSEPIDYPIFQQTLDLTQNQ